MRATDRHKRYYIPIQGNRNTVPSGKENLERGTVAQSTPYIYYNTAVNSEINLLASPRGKNVIPSVRLNLPAGGTYHLSHTTFPEGVSEIRERKQDETRRDSLLESPVNFSIKARVDTVQKTNQTHSTPRAIYFALSRFQTNYDLDRSLSPTINRSPVLNIIFSAVRHWTSKNDKRKD